MSHPIARFLYRGQLILTAWGRGGGRMGKREGGGWGRERGVEGEGKNSVSN